MHDRVKGFRDFYPAEMAKRRAVISTLEETAFQFGFQEIATPALERTDLYIEKSGPEVVDELFSFSDQGGRNLALTPELTPTVARMVVRRQQELSKPIKWVSTRPFWRYEEPQQGRYREFYQTNVDIFGSSSPAADAEVLAWAASGLRSLGLAPAEFEFRISHRDILSGLLEWIEPDVETAPAIRAVDKRAKVEPEHYRGLLESAGLTDGQIDRFESLLERGSEDLEDLADAVESDRVLTAIENLQAVLSMADSMAPAAPLSVSLTTARGLDYYTGVVFECFDTSGAVGRSIFGGGRYDDLIESFGGPSIPAVGVAPGLAPLMLLLERTDNLPQVEIGPHFYVLTVGDTREEAASITGSLRERGYAVETDVSGRSFGAQLEYADAIGATSTIIVGERDLAENQVTIKDMETGAQEAIPLESLPEAVEPNA